MTRGAPTEGVTTAGPHRREYVYIHWEIHLSDKSIPLGQTVYRGYGQLVVNSQPTNC